MHVGRRLKLERENARIAKQVREGQRNDDATKNGDTAHARRRPRVNAPLARQIDRAELLRDDRRRVHERVRDGERHDGHEKHYQRQAHGYGHPFALARKRSDGNRFERARAEMHERNSAGSELIEVGRLPQRRLSNSVRHPRRKAALNWTVASEESVRFWLERSIEATCVMKMRYCKAYSCSL